MNYGVPYMGSKSTIAKEIISRIPSATHFYDLFGGGFSVTHAMLVHRRNDFKYFHFNEIRPGVCEMIKRAINGDYSYEKFQPPWVSREEFFAKKEIDPYIKLCWSFGNNGKDYLFGEDIESYKRSMHNAVVFNRFDDTAKKIFGMEQFKDGFLIEEKRSLLTNRVKVLNPGKTEGELRQLQQLQQLERLEQLQKLQQLERLQRLEQLERLSFYSVSYEQVPIKDDSIVYCDIPYEGTGEYDKNKTFNRKHFLDWASSQIHPVFISEYNVSDERFKCVASIRKRSKMDNSKSNALMKVEKIYVNQVAYNLLRGK